MAVVYCYHCIPTGKKYIGVTNNEKERIWSHKTDSRTRQSKFYQAVNEYGWDSFIYGIVDECMSMESAYALESYYINKHNTVAEGYNTTQGGNGKIPRPKKVKTPKWKIEFKDGRYIRVTNLKEYASLNNYSYVCLCRVHSGQAYTHKDIVSVYQPDKDREEDRKYRWEIEYNTGEIVKTNDLTNWCKHKGYKRHRVDSIYRSGVSNYGIVGITKQGVRLRPK